MERRIRFLLRAASTNSYLTERAAEMENGEAAVAFEQTAGRGQRGNSWESRPGANLTLSVLLRPEGVDIARAFPLSEAVAMAAVDLLVRLMPEMKERIAVKWPNDIYVDNLKMAGILIENSLSGRMISRSVAGIGVNINQKEFVSDAPNPVSMWQLTGREYPIPVVATMFLDSLDRMLRLMQSSPEQLHLLYMSRLWRGEGMYPFRDVASGETFDAQVDSVAESGHITLTDSENRQRTYAFKEIEWLMA